MRKSFKCTNQSSKPKRYCQSPKISLLSQRQSQRKPSPPRRRRRRKKSRSSKRFKSSQLLPNSSPSHKFNLTQTLNSSCKCLRTSARSTSEKSQTGRQRWTSFAPKTCFCSRLPTLTATRSSTTHKSFKLS